MARIATLDSSVRLVVFQFLMRSAQVPAIIPQKRPLGAPPLTPVSGVKVMESTPRLNIFGLASKLACGKNYELVDVWQSPHEAKWGMSFVRFVFCHKQHLNPLSIDFVNKVNSLEKVLVDLVSNNLWAVQGHLNPYFENGSPVLNPSGQHVLMLGCAGRIPNTEVFSGGRDENGRGIGPKVLLTDKANRLKLVNNEIVLVPPVMIPAKAEVPERR